MDNCIFEKLKDYVEAYGEESISDGLRCKGYLKDFCGESKRDIFMVSSAIKERVPTKLREASKSNDILNLELEVHRQEMVLVQNLGFSEDYSSLIVKAWLYALDIDFKEKKEHKNIDTKYSLEEVEVKTEYMTIELEEKPKSYVRPIRPKKQKLIYWSDFKGVVDAFILLTIVIGIASMLNYGRSINLEIPVFKEKSIENSSYEQGDIYIGDEGYIYGEGMVETVSENNIDYSIYSNSRYGYLTHYPSHFEFDIAPDNGDGQSFYCPNGSAHLVVYGENNIFQETVDSMYSDRLSFSSNIDYKVKSDDWYVVSWMDRDYEYYERVHVGSGSINTMRWSYLKAEEHIYSPMIEKSSLSFTPGNLESAH